MIQYIIHANCGQPSEVESSKGTFRILVHLMHHLPHHYLQLLEVVRLAQVVFIGLRQTDRAEVFAGGVCVISDPLLGQCLITVVSLKYCRRFAPFLWLRDLYPRV